MLNDYSQHPKTIDVHVHADEDDADKIKFLADTCRKNNVLAVLLGGANYGSGDMIPNERVAEIAEEYPDVFLFGARFDLWNTPPDPEDVTKYVRMGAVMLKFIRPWFAYDDDLYMPVYERAEMHRIPCIFHTGNYAQCERDRVDRRPIVRNMHPITLDRIARSFQDLPIIMAHLGTTYFRHEAAEYIKHYKNMYFDLAGSGSWGTLTARDMVELMGFTIPFADLRLTGFHKMVIGSDSYINYPENIGAAQAYHRIILEQAGIPADLEAEIRHGTMEKLFAAIRRDI